MKKNLLIFTVVLLSISTTAQTNQQLIAVNQFSNLTAMNSIASPIKGSLAFNAGNNFLYYYNGTTWVQTPSASGWSLTGNSIGSSNFLGTTNNEPLRFRVNNTEKAVLEPRGSLTLNGEYYGVYIGLDLNGQNETTGAYGNIGIGAGALPSVTSGSSNIALGGVTCGDLTTGYHNTAIGVNSLSSATTGYRNTAIGASAYFIGNYYNSTALGAGASIGANNHVRLGGNVVSIGGLVSWTTVSDKRFKENVKDNVLGLDFIMGLKPLTYNFNSKKLDKFQRNTDTISTEEHYQMLYDITQIGFLAQDVEALADSLNFDFHGVDAADGPADIYGLRYAEFVVPIVKAMQEQQAIINKQETLMKSLLKRIETLEGQIGK